MTNTGESPQLGYLAGLQDSPCLLYLDSSWPIDEGGGERELDAIVTPLELNVTEKWRLRPGNKACRHPGNRALGKRRTCRDICRNYILLAQDLTALAGAVHRGNRKAAISANSRPVISTFAT